MAKTNIKYFDPQKNWHRIKPHLAAVEPILVRDMHKFTFGRWKTPFTSGMVPHDVESCDWWCDHRGRMPAYWQYVKHSACHWLVNFNLELAQRVLPQYPWHILSSKEHSTVYNGIDLLWDFNLCAMGVPACESYRLATHRGKILKPGKHLTVHFANWYENE